MAAHDVMQSVLDRDARLLDEQNVCLNLSILQMKVDRALMPLDKTIQFMADLQRWNHVPSLHVISLMRAVVTVELFSVEQGHTFTCSPEVGPCDGLALA